MSLRSLNNPKARFLDFYSKTETDSSSMSQGQVIATGGTLLTPGNGFAYHVFTSPGSFVLSTSATAQVLIVAGGGGGGGYAYGGGGGAGGVVYGSSVPLSAQTYTVTIGSGGAGAAPSAIPGPSNMGAPSSFGPVTALGGGAGGTFNDPGGRLGTSGGSAGGNSGYLDSTITAAPQPVPASYIAYGSPSISYNYGEGGGGAGGSNQPNPFAPLGSVGSVGGPGQAFPVFPSTIIAPAIPAPEQPFWNPEVGPQGYFGGGGGGAAYYTTANVPAGGIGGGDGGGPYPGGPVNGWPGVNFTGGGGGGTNYNTGGVNPRNPTFNGGSGGSGIVIVRYSV